MKRRLTQRRKDAKKGNNDLLLRKEETAVLCGLCGFARACRCLKRRLTQRRQDAKKGQNDALLGTEKTALLGGLCGFARPCRCLKRRLTQRRKDAKKGKRYSVSHSGTQSPSHLATQARARRAGMAARRASDKGLSAAGRATRRALSPADGGEGLFHRRVHLLNVKRPGDGGVGHLRPGVGQVPDEYAAAVGAAGAVGDPGAAGLGVEFLRDLNELFDGPRHRPPAKRQPPACSRRCMQVLRGAMERHIREAVTTTAPLCAVGRETHRARAFSGPRTCVFRPAHGAERPVREAIIQGAAIRRERPAALARSTGPCGFAFRA